MGVPARTLLLLYLLTSVDVAGVADHVDVVVSTSLWPLYTVLIIIFIIMLCMLCVELATYRRSVILRLLLCPALRLRRHKAVVPRRRHRHRHRHRHGLPRRHPREDRRENVGVSFSLPQE